MKNTYLLSLSLVAATASVAFGSVALGSLAVQYSGIFYSVVPCVFLLLLALGEYGRKARYSQMSETLAHKAATTQKQSLRLAA